MNNPVLNLARFFVTSIVGRRWTPADYRSRHMKAASTLLNKMKYDYDAVVAALTALDERDYVQFGYDSDRGLPSPPLQGMEVLYCWGEPPLIERFLRPPEMPPVYSTDYDPWVLRWGKLAIKRGEWDGVYMGENVGLWLVDIIGDERYEDSVAWRKQRESQPRKLLSDT